jgi:hypothetical protein
MKSFGKILVSSVVMGISGWAVLHGELWQRSGNSTEKAAYLTGTIFLCFGIYIGCSYVLKNEEMGYVYETMKRRFGRKREGA